jgi:hypothetical protein
MTEGTLWGRCKCCEGGWAKQVWGVFGEWVLDNVFYDDVLYSMFGVAWVVWWVLVLSV